MTSSVGRRWKPSAPARRTRKPSCGCAACETKPTSSISPKTPRIALTSGEPAGIGPELCLALAAQELPCELVCLADRTLLATRVRQLQLPVRLHDYAPHAAPVPHVP